MDVTYFRRAANYRYCTAGQKLARDFVAVSSRFNNPANERLSHGHHPHTTLDPMGPSRERGAPRLGTIYLSEHFTSGRLASDFDKSSATNMMAQHADLSQYLGYGETGLPLDGRPVRNMDAPHSERHSSHGDLMRNFIIGFSDGLTVPFALTAGLSSLGSPRLVILAGLAELFSGAISMGLGAYLAAVSDAKQYAVEEARERAEIVQCPLAEEKEIYDIFAEYGIYRVDAYLAVERLKDNPDMWLRVREPCATS